MNCVICPTVTAFDKSTYTQQVKVAASISKRIHIDVMDGEFTPTKSPDLSQIWWPHESKADIHLMFKDPMDELDKLLELKPRLVVIHAEAALHHMHFAGELHKAGIKTGLAALQNTSIESIEFLLPSFDHILVFSGDLGRHGGTADLSLLDKVKRIKEFHPDVEIGWDGGINEQNIQQLKNGGVDVFNVGGFIQENINPEEAYAKLKKLIDHK